MCNLVQTSFVYRVPVSQTSCGFGFWEFTIVSNQNGTLGVQNIKSPQGYLCNSGIQIPPNVWDCVNEAKQQVENLLAVTSAVNGTLNFVNQTALSVVFATPFPNALYRVHVTTHDFVAARVTNQTTTGFDIEMGVTYTGLVGYDVFV